ncbi:MAG: hypothetical protein A2622_06460 [Bdellovibrionales bacterium RIFCSPHIGHO2_01_FULL_40_29]|nr:MAG: hypothetical protein A2622_06460 [Bdellovibrionales bacterium RIFCSPHIGHO2_01_FULL_40_29]OFZ35085.1 MAG: hypothetical protein A3D17_06810 [Bdellovibrionales bacterium RIFCSPHIGHO2_02_FULL_40_15]
MIKLVSFFIFVAAFVWTWSLLTTKSTIGIDVHAGIQSKLAIMIQDTIKANRPNSSNFELSKIYTEKLDDNKIKAYFSYKFNDTLEDQESSEQQISGQAILNRSISEDPNIQKWVIQSVKTDTNAIEFKEGIVISTDGTETPAITSEPIPEEKTTK